MSFAQSFAKTASISSPTTSTTSTTTSSTVYCYVANTDYEGDDLANQPIKDIANAHDCQVKCVNTQECKYFTYMDASMDDERAGSCWLKDGQGEIKSYTGLTSGPKYCKGESLLCGGSLQICTHFMNFSETLVVNIEL